MTKPRLIKDGTSVTYKGVKAVVISGWSIGASNRYEIEVLRGPKRGTWLVSQEELNSKDVK